MTNKKVLIVDDEDTQLKMLVKMVMSLGYEAVGASNGKEAIELYDKEPFPVVVADINMPVMDGNELIQRLNDSGTPPVVIVQTVNIEASQVIETMKNTVYDYLIKPITIENLGIRLKNAMEAYELRKMEKILHKEKLARLESQIEWFKWNEGFIKRDYDRVDKTLFKSLHTSFNQGAGFGALLTLLNLIKSSAQKKGDSYLLNAQLFEMINISTNIAQKAIDLFSDMSVIFTSNFDLKKSSLLEVYIILQNIINKQQKYTDIHQQTVLLSEKKPGFENQFVMIDQGYLYKALYELLINAFKFSRKKSNILIIVEHATDDVLISIISTPDTNDRDVEGIPPEYESLIFEPFFRMTDSVFEEFESIDFGLGLTMAQKIIEKHGGTITVSNVMDNSDLRKDPALRVNFQVSIPLAREGSTDNQ